MASEHDREILNSIFNPLLPTGEVLFDDSIPEELREDESCNILVSEDEKKSKEFEMEGIKAAERGELEQALKLFSDTILLSPSRASGYNNRAQTYRLLGQTAEARIDLNNAINLSEGKGKAACQAHCQRGLLNLKEFREAEAKADFEEAAKFGSQFAKAQLVQMNPYAALCNKMLKNMIGKIQSGDSDLYASSPESKK